MTVRPPCAPRPPGYLHIGGGRTALCCWLEGRHRGGEQPQLSQALEAQATASHRLRELVAWIGTHPQEDLSVEAMADRVQMSPRNFARAFAAQTGRTPARFVEQTRVAAAAQLLRQTQWTQEKIASRSGFRSVDALQRAFARQHGVTPQGYRDEGGASR